jgi:hypothetical protein
VFTCVGALALADALDRVDGDLVSWWLAERQTRSGGLNGRPEKLQDVCYSWWCLSCLAILGRLHWIDRGALTNFILWCQVGGARGGGEHSRDGVPGVPRLTRHPGAAALDGSLHNTPITRTTHPAPIPTPSQPLPLG